jgi:hypothetical protein
VVSRRSAPRESDLNAEFNEHPEQRSDLVSPFTKAISLGGFALNFDAANTIALTGTTSGVSLTGGTLREPTEDTITAFATGGQTNATALSVAKKYHRISVCATVADSVKLPTSTAGQAHYVRNDGAASCSGVRHEPGHDQRHRYRDWRRARCWSGLLVRMHDCRSMDIDGVATSQTLTNKTLTSPAINTPTVASPAFSGSFSGSYTIGGTITLGGSQAFAINDVVFNSSNSAAGSTLLTINDSNRDSLKVFANADGTSANAANCVLRVRQAQVTARSINAAGTINASGADYAEYETKRADCGVIAKGAIVGFDENGLLTDQWSLAVTFGVKSTSPSYVGGDAWGRPEDPCPLDGQPIGLRPVEPIKTQLEALPDDAQEEDVAAQQASLEAIEAAHAEATQAHALALAAWEARLEAARQRVDRIAYAGKVPANVLGAKPGQWIDAAQDGEGIKGVPVDQSGPNTVGRVRRILPDGRAEISL